MRKLFVLIIFYLRSIIDRWTFMKVKIIYIFMFILALGVQTSCVESTYTDGHEWVDLGLPSGTLWATCNVGANSPEEYGDYFAWGETQPKENYNSYTYKYYSDTPPTKYGYTPTKYCTDGEYGCVDNKNELELEDDAATVNWGNSWQTPSLDQFKELFSDENTTITWTTLNGVSGREIKSKKNGNSIFLPDASYYSESSCVNKRPIQSYWSRSLVDNPFLAYCISLDNPSVLCWHYRYMGMTVRPVRK